MTSCAGGLACGTAASEDHVMDALLREGAAWDAYQASRDTTEEDKARLKLLTSALCDERYDCDDLLVMTCGGEAM